MNPSEIEKKINQTLRAVGGKGKTNVLAAVIFGRVSPSQAEMDTFDSVVREMVNQGDARLVAEVLELA